MQGPAVLCCAMQGRATNPALERDESERLFRDHVQDLQEAANEAYLDLLDAVILVRRRSCWWEGVWAGVSWHLDGK